MVAEHQFEYYDVLGEAQRDADCTGFVVFMLHVILETIDQVDAEQINEQIYDQITERQWVVVEFLQKNSRATLDDIAAVAGASVATVRRDLARLRELGVVSREGSRKAGHWEVFGQT